MQTHSVLKIVYTIIAVIAITKSTESAKILAIFPYPGPSQYIAVLPYLKSLAGRGHDVTVINTHPRNEKVPNFHEVPILEVHDTYAELLNELVGSNNKWNELKAVSEVAQICSRAVLANPTVQQWLKDKTVKFDLIIIEALILDSLYALGPHFGAPLIGFSSYGTDVIIDQLVGNISPLSYSSFVLSGLPYKMSYWQRVYNVLMTWFFGAFIQFYHFPRQELLYKEHFPHLDYDLRDIRTNFSLILLNQHFSTATPRPYVPNMIEVGGFHIQHKPAPLPKDIDDFINKYSANGVIYFSMGSNIQSKDFPPEQLKIFLDVFKSLDMGVLWKFENPNLTDKPKNVFIKKWLPQGDILAHANVKLFITHSGLLSTTETIYHGKPALGLPVMLDQITNAKFMVDKGYGLSMDINNLNAKELREKILEIVKYNPTYAQRAAHLSKLYRDQPMPPLERAIYWTEYVLRYNGAPHMRVLGQKMNYITENSIDTIGFIVLVIIIILLLIFVLFKCIFTSLCRMLNVLKKPKSD